MRMKQRVVLECWDKWRDLLNKAQNDERKTSAILFRITRIAQARAFATWKQVMQVKKAAETLFQRSTFYMKMRSMEDAWLAWRELRNKQKRSNTSIWLQRIRGSAALARTFYRWAAWTISNICKHAFSLVVEKFATVDIGALTFALEDDLTKVEPATLIEVFGKVSDSLKEARAVLTEREDLVAHIRRCRSMVNGFCPPSLMSVSPGNPGKVLPPGVEGITAGELGLSPGAQQLLLLRQRNEAEAQAQEYMHNYYDIETAHIKKAVRLAAAETELELVQKRNSALEDAVKSASKTLKKDSVAMIYSNGGELTPNKMAAWERRRTLEQEVETLLSTRKELDSELERAAGQPAVRSFAKKAVHFKGATAGGVPGTPSRSRTTPGSTSRTPARERSSPPKQVSSVSRLSRVEPLRREKLGEHAQSDDAEATPAKPTPRSAAWKPPYVQP